jgi:hypothetical protein
MNTLHEICGSHGAIMKITALWDVTQCSLIEVYQHFEGTSCLLQDQKGKLYKEAANSIFLAVSLYGLLTL